MLKAESLRSEIGRENLDRQQRNVVYLKLSLGKHATFIRSIGLILNK